MSGGETYGDANHPMTGNPLSATTNGRIDPQDLQQFAQSSASTGLNLSRLTQPTIQNMDEYNSVFGAFNAWKSARDADNAQRAQYLTLTQDSPGRQATILTDPSTDLNPTLLTPPKRTRTLLG